MGNALNHEPVAVVAIGCRLPGGANTPEQFWQLLSEGVDAIREVPSNRFDVAALFDADPRRPGTLYTRWGGFADDVDTFDAEFFGISPREAARIDPQQRLLLEVVWEALEDGGHPAESIAGSRAGVFIGISTHDYCDVQINPAHRHLIDSHTSTGTASSIAANRISYVYDLRGASMAVDTACSSSLTAVHLACRSIRNQECDLAIAGGVNVVLNPETAIGFCRASMLSPDGRCKAFDIGANGFVRGEGAAVVLLKPLGRAVADGDRIYALVRGSAINQDGRTVGMTVPSVEAQRSLIQAALRDAGAEPADVQYVEAHGTGTRVGDPIEAAAIGGALSPGRSGTTPCLIGSVKTNLGHLEAAAGITGFVKTALALEHRQIPPSLHFTAVNPAIPLDDLQIRIATSLQPWPVNGTPALAGVNSFGFGGANAHVLLQEPPAAPSRPADEVGSAHIVPISARHPKALQGLLRSYRDVIAAGTAPLQDISYSAAVRRSHHPLRVALVGAAREDLLDQIDARLEAADTDWPARSATPKVAFVFTGMGTQWWAMGRQLLDQEPVFRDVIEKCDRHLRDAGAWALLPALMADETSSRVDQADLAVVANLAIQMALVELWGSWGVTADAHVGHSAGEIAAACAAGAISLEDAVVLAFHRGRLQFRAAGTGTMLGAGVPEEVAARLIAPVADRASIAAVNSPTSVTLSGDRQTLEDVAAELTRQQRFNRFLRVDIPYHAPQMDALRSELLRSLAFLKPRPPRVPLFSTVSGRRVEGPPHPQYWFDNLREPVRFAAAIDRLIDDGHQLFVEIGPHPALGASISECLAARGKNGMTLPTIRRMENERAVMLRSLAELYTRGVRVNWSEVCRAGSFVPLPRYPWQRDRHWFEPGQSIARPAGVDTGRPLLGCRLRSVRPSWEVDLDQPQLAYLTDHVVHGSPVFPAAAFVEMALAASREMAPDAVPVLEELTFRKVLNLAQPGTVVQLACDPDSSSFEIHSAPRDGRAAWTLNAGGRLGTRPPDAPSCTIDLTAVQARCPTEVSSEDVYRALGERGLSYKGAFRGIQRLWQGDGEALAQIAPAPEAHDGRNSYQIHPALLDAALQALLAAADGDAVDPQRRRGGLYLPVSIKRLTMFRTPGAACWSHVTAVGLPSGMLEGTVTIADSDGTIAVTIDGLRCLALEKSAGGDATLEGLLYDLRWEPKPPTERRRSGLARLRTSGRVAELAKARIDQLSAETGSVRMPDEAGPTLDAVVARYARGALSSLGWDLRTPLPDDAQELGGRLGIPARHRRLLGRLLEILRDVPVPDDQGTAAGERASAALLCERLLGEQPACVPLVELLRRTGERLDAILSNQADAREVLFAPGALAIWARFFAELPWYHFYNTAVAETVATALEDTPPSTPIRVLEIGAGTGGTTRSVMARLEGRTVEYFFTDVSTLFLAQARERFRDHPSVHVSSLDLEEEPIAQIGTEPFDIVLAANVMHATRDLRTSLEHVKRLLAPGGLLVLLEACRKIAWADLIFGVTDGWWRFTDVDLRPAHPLLAPGQWCELLSNAGFDEPISLLSHAGGTNPAQAVIVATLPRPVHADLPHTPEPARQSWVAFVDPGDVCEQIVSALQARGDRCIRVVRGVDYRKSDGETFEISAGNPEHMARMLGELTEREFPLAGLIHAWSLAAPLPPSITTDELIDAQQATCGSVIAIVQAFAKHGRTMPPIWLLTSGAQVVEAQDSSNIAQAPLWGLGRVFASEYPDVPCRLIDLGADCGPREIQALLDELAAPDADEEIAFRGSERYVTRLRRTRVDDASTPRLELSPEQHAFRLDIDTPGALESLTLREVADRRPGPGEILLRVIAAGVNFRDVMLSLGMLPPMVIPGRGPRTILGFECAGIVMDCGEGVEDFRAGDEVVAIALGAFGSRVVTRAEMVVPKPRRLTFEQAATIPLVFVTAHYGLNHLARLSAGERVLIHAASGGVGLAAIQLARRTGADIFATAGSPEKRAYLASIGVDRVMDSRSSAFADEVLGVTGGEGVDVVLNSLTGDAIPKGLAILRPYGRFVEIGKRDIYADAPIGLLPFDKNLSFCSVALDRMCLDRPALVGKMLREVMALVEQRVLEPIPHTAYDLADAEPAFRYLAQAKHIGKVVLTVREPAYAVVPGADRALCRPDATYLITGGLGGFGLASARWMVGQGARHIALMSRSGAPVPENAQAFEKLNHSVEVVVFKGDASSEKDVRRMLDTIRATMPPVRGILHTAMVLDDVPMRQLDADRFRAVITPKIGGAWNLHRLTADRDLDFFVMFSSTASVVGPAGQANYAAGNVFLDALAGYRRTLGLPALSIGWGALADVGYVARHADVARSLSRQGMQSLTPKEAEAVLERALRRNFSHVVAARFDWQRWSALETRSSAVKKSQRLQHFASVATTDASDSTQAGGSVVSVLLEAPPTERPSMLEGFLVERVARVLGTSRKKVDVELALTDMGVDSLMGVELETVMARDFGVDVPFGTLLEGITVRQLAGVLLSRLAVGGAPPADQAAVAPRDITAGAAPPTTASGLAAAGDARERSPASAAEPTRETPAPPNPIAPRGVVTEPALPATAVTAPRRPADEVAGAASGHAHEGVRRRRAIHYGSLDYSRWSPSQSFSRRLAAGLFRAFGRVQTLGLENIPRTGPLVVAINHLSMLDILLLLTILPRRGVCMAADRLQDSWPIGWWLDLGQTIYVHRGEADHGALDDALEVLRAGGLIGIAPEGTRSPTGGLTRGHSGAAYLAAKAGAPILPIAAYGHERLMDNARQLRRTRICVRVGSLLTVEPGDTSAAGLLRETERVMTALASMLPVSYRGVYADAVQSAERSKADMAGVI